MHQFKKIAITTAILACMSTGAAFAANNSDSAVIGASAQVSNTIGHTGTDSNLNFGNMIMSAGQAYSTTACTVSILGAETCTGIATAATVGVNAGSVTFNATPGSSVTVTVALTNSNLAPEVGDASPLVLSNITALVNNSSTVTTNSSTGANADAVTVDSTHLVTVKIGGTVSIPEGTPSGVYKNNDAITVSATVN